MVVYQRAAESRRMSVRALIGWLILLDALAFVVLPQRFEIVTPRLTRPQILPAGQTFDLELRHALPLPGDHYRVELVGDNVDRTVLLPSASSASDLRGRTLAVTVPDDLPEGRYNLRVSLRDAVRRQSHAVFVREHWPSNLTLLHASDLPQFHHRDGLGKMGQLVAEINLINPDVVLLSGDLAKGGTDWHYNVLLAYLRQVRVPLIAAPGNHAHDGWSGYLGFIGEPRHVTDLGPWRVVSVDSGHGRDQFTLTQLDWLYSELRRRPQTPTIVQLHHPLFQRRHVRARVPEALALLETFNVLTVLSGHMHANMLFDGRGERIEEDTGAPGIRYIVTTAAGDTASSRGGGAVYNGYRLLVFDQGQLQHYGYDYDDDGTRESVSSVPLGRLRVEHDGDDRVNVTNELNESFTDARVVLSHTRPDRVPRGGELRRRYTHGDVHYYELGFDLGVGESRTLWLAAP